jgi:hypothetical protein
MRRNLHTAMLAAALTLLAGPVTSARAEEPASAPSKKEQAAEPKGKDKDTDTRIEERWRRRPPATASASAATSGSPPTACTATWSSASTA